MLIFKGFVMSNEMKHLRKTNASILPRQDKIESQNDFIAKIRKLSFIQTKRDYLFKAISQYLLLFM
ncbi:hypothetical protein D0T56_03010 [Dysgonomonas sp. 520]|nr:hypothetical protein [Dysgonomonas sp. 520]